MQQTAHESFGAPAEVREFPNGRAEIVKIGDAEIGRLTFEAILSRDYPLVLASTAFSAVMVLLANLAADLLHALADPRIRDAHHG